jgi:exonuclease SbcD
MARLQTRFEHVVTIHFAPEGAPAQEARARTEGRSDHRIALDFVAAVRGTPASEQESALLRDACECGARDPEADSGADPATRAVTA